MFFYKEYISLIKVSFLSNLPHFEVETVLLRITTCLVSYMSLWGARNV